ncbi:hypothetical protein N7526_000091 [Penicillium atrosanguineum]|nr:hypothetical protein N7526_000091 [Penicillium atrosanguineum]
MSTLAKSVEKMGKSRGNTRRAGYPSHAATTSLSFNAVIFNRSSSNMAWTKAAQWIWTPKYLEEENRPGRYFLFRKTFQRTGQAGGELPVHVSADSRYRLFVNGQRDLSLSTDESWKCLEETTRQIIPHQEWNYILGPPFLSNNERVSENRQLAGWKFPGFDDSAWESATLQFRPVKMLPVTSPWKLAPRPIPELPELPGQFDGVAKCQGSITHEQWSGLIKDSRSITILAGESVTVDMETKSLTTAFVNLQCGGGKGSVITLLYAECYELDLGVETAPFPKPRSKSNRADSRGRLYGMKDIYTVADGQPKQTFEPFWFRAFRYIQLQITASDQPLILESFTFRETFYPLEISTRVQAGPELDNIWKISLRTLQNCRHETFEDCPFYEQNQFASDSRLQMLFNYQISSDDRLARKTIQEFHASQGPDGLIKAQFPAGFRSTQIPQFSLYFVAMINDHMHYFADSALVCRYLSTIDGILSHFDERLNELGLVGRFEDDAWPFIDWVPEWFVPGKIFESCMPKAYTSTGAATFNSLLYVVALMQAAELCNFSGRRDTATEYNQRADAIRKAVNTHCYEDGLYLDGPAAKEYSQHSQVFAILSESITGAAARELMSRALEDSSLAQCSYSMKFYLFRAVEKVGLYTELFHSLMDPWRKMIADNLTTWAEFENNARSDCHGWSASPVHEIVTQLFGVSPARPGFKRVRIAPKIRLLESARGTFFTPVADITVGWTADGNLEVEATADVEAEIVIDGSPSVRQLEGGKSFVFIK